MLNRKIAIGVSVPVMALALSATASFANSNEGTVTADALNVRSGPSTSYGITTKLYKGDKVEILTPGEFGESFVVEEIYNENEENIDRYLYLTKSSNISGVKMEIVIS